MNTGKSNQKRRELFYLIKMENKTAIQKVE